MQEQVRIFGVDVAKAQLVICTHGQAASGTTLANERRSLQAWLASLPTGSIVAMEATGTFHRLLAELAHAAGMQVYVLNARDVYFYAKALSARGKTDRLDAGVIARYVAEHHASLHPWHPATGAQEQLQALLKRRWLLTRQLVMLRQSFSDMPTLQQTWLALQQEYTRAFEALDGQLAALVDAEPQLSLGVQRLRTITGFGAQASILLGALFSRIHFDNADAVVAYSGLDPRPSDSGTRHGRRRLSKRGPGMLRYLLYLAAASAAHSKALGPLYLQIKARGFAPTQALVILARKLLRIAWAIWNSDKTFDTARFPASEDPARV